LRWEYELTDLDVVTLNHMPAAALVELIVTAVRGYQHRS